MKFRQILRKEQGLTLVELLAAISLFVVLIALASTLIFQLLDRTDKQNDQIALKQDTNVLISSLRNQYYQGNSSICIPNEETRFTVKEISVSNGIVIDDCIQNVKKESPLTIKITTTNKTGQDFTLATTWMNQEDYKITINVSDKSDYEQGELTGKNCNYIGNVRFDTDYVNTDYVCSTDGNALFTNDLTIYKGSLQLTVGGNAMFDGSISLDMNNPNKIELTIIGDAIFNGNLNLGKNKTEIYVYGDAYFNGDMTFVKNKTEIYVKGMIYINGELVGEDECVNDTTCSKLSIEP